MSRPTLAKRVSVVTWVYWTALVAWVKRRWLAVKRVSARAEWRR